MKTPVATEDDEEVRRSEKKLVDSNLKENISPNYLYTVEQGTEDSTPDAFTERCGINQVQLSPLGLHVEFQSYSYFRSSAVQLDIAVSSESIGYQSVF